MNALVELRQNQVVTTSIKVAEEFDKQHRHVMRDINNLKDNMPDEKDVPEFGQMFKLSQMPDSYGRMRNMYYMSKDGLVFLIMGYRGKKANLIKLRYIQAFNVMQAELNDRWTITAEAEAEDHRLYNTSFIGKQFNMSAYDVNQQLIKSGVIQYNAYFNCYVLTDYYRNQHLAQIVNYHDNRNHRDVKWLKWTRAGRNKVQDILEYVGKKTSGQDLLDEQHVETIEIDTNNDNEMELIDMGQHKDTKDMDKYKYEIAKETIKSEADDNEFSKLCHRQQQSIIDSYEFKQAVKKMKEGEDK